MSSENWMPPPLPPPDLAAFRRELVGLGEPAETPGGVAVSESVKRHAAEFCGVLADLYGREHAGDAQDMWKDIGKAVAVSAAASPPTDFAAFACGCLPHLQVPPESAAYEPAFERLLDAVSAQGDATAAMLIGYLAGPLRVVALTAARAARKQKQATRAAAGEASRA